MDDSYSVFQEILKRKGLTAYKVSKATGVSTATITSWKNGAYKPKRDKLQKIADFLEEKIEVFYPGTPTSIPQTDLSPVEWDIIRKFRRITDDQQVAILTTLNAFYGMALEKRKRNFHIVIGGKKE